MEDAQGPGFYIAGPGDFQHHTVTAAVRLRKIAVGKIDWKPGFDQAGCAVRLTAEKAGVDRHRAATGPGRIGGAAVTAQSGGEFRIGVEIRDTYPRFSMDDHEKHMARVTQGLKGCQFFQVFQGPFRGGVGKHGDSMFYQGTGLYLYQVAFPLPVKTEKVKTGIPYRKFGLNFTDAGDDLRQNQFFRRLVCPGGAKGDYAVPVVKPRRRPAGCCLGSGFPLFQDQPGSGNIVAPVPEKFDKPARIGAVTVESCCSVPGNDEETIRPFLKQRFPVVSE
jgi:hypothetical protein